MTSFDLHKKYWVGHVTPRQAEVISLVAEGLKNKEIATLLFVTDDSIKRHIAHANCRLGTHSRVGLVVWWYTNVIMRQALDKELAKSTAQRRLLEQIRPMAKGELLAHIVRCLT